MTRIQIRQTFLDKIIGQISPTRGLARAQARYHLDAATGSYNGGARDRRPTKRWRPKGGSPDADTLLDLPDLRARSRDLARNAPIATGAIATGVTNVVGDGLQLQAAIDAEALGITAEAADAMERQQEREWRTFCKSCDFTRVQNFDELQSLAYRASQESGDVFILRRYRKDAGDAYGTKLQVLEADRVSNPARAADTDKISGGVEYDDHGVPIAYHVSNKHPGGLRTGSMTWERVLARTPAGKQTVIHLFDRTRPELSRGIPYLAPVIEHLKQISDYSDAEVTAAVISAMFTLAIETPNEEGEPVIGETDASLPANEVKMGNGAVISLAPGEKATSINPARPNAQFDPFMLAFLRQIGVALELPFEVLIKHFTASYSASRAALEMAWQFFRKRRTWLASRFCQVVYEWVIEEAVAAGRLNRPGFFADPTIRDAYLGGEWIGPQRASLNPKQEAEADALDIDTGTKTIEQVCMERTGGSFEKKNAQRAKEHSAREASGLNPKPAPSPFAKPSDPPPADSTSGSDDETQPARSDDE